MNLQDITIQLGTSQNLPSIIISIGNSTGNDVFAFLHDNNTLSIISWIKNFVGFGFIGGAVLKTISNIHNIISGEANLISGGDN